MLKGPRYHCATLTTREGISWDQKKILFFLYKVKFACYLIFKIDSFIWKLVHIFYLSSSTCNFCLENKSQSNGVWHSRLSLSSTPGFQTVSYGKQKKWKKVSNFFPYFSRENRVVVSKFALFRPYSKAKQQVNNYQQNPETRASNQSLILALV